MNPLRVTHVITGLGLGGAEIMLERLLSAFDTNRVHSEVICLDEGGPLVAPIRAKGIPLAVLGIASASSVVAGVPRIVQHLRRSRPDVVHTWMYHADLLGGLAGKIARVPVVWALHCTKLDPAQTPRSTLLLLRVLSQLAAIIPERIVSCSVAGRELHEQMGYPGRRMLVIPNGFDAAEFKPNHEQRKLARNAWGFDEECVVVGQVARFHPQKDHHCLIQAAGLARARDQRLRFVFFGTDVTNDNARLVAWAREAGVSSICRFLGPHSHIHEVLPGFDLLASPSRFGEAFPLVIGEAMASGVPCVVTDVGDSALMVGDTGRVVPPDTPPLLAEALLELAALDRKARTELGARATARVRREFSLARVAHLYTELYQSVADGEGETSTRFTR